MFNGRSELRGTIEGRVALDENGKEREKSPRRTAEKVLWIELRKVLRRYLLANLSGSHSGCSKCISLGE